MNEELKLKGKNNPKIKSIVDDDVLKFYFDKEDLSDPEYHFQWDGPSFSGVR